MLRSITTALLSVTAFLAMIWTTEAWAPHQSASQNLNRRQWMAKQLSVATTSATIAAVIVGSGVSPAHAAVDVGMLAELEASIEKMKPIPNLLADKEWDKVRSILKLPPVNKLWNLGDSQNTIVKLARETGNIELFELKDDLMYNLQMCDQLTYNNAFVYFQPGSGKFNIKEPQDMAKRAMGQIQQAIDIAKEG